MPKKTLPFKSFDAIPASAYQPQMPTKLNGVEMQAAAKRPPLPMINTAASDRMAKLGMSLPANAPTPTPQVVSGPGMMPTPQAPAASPFGGMPTAPLSGRGGPSSYSPKGVGTTNPNSYAVGKNNRDFPARPAPMTVSGPGMMPQQSAPMPMLGGPNPARVAGPGMQPQTQAPINPMGRDDAFWAGLKQQSVDYQTQNQATQATAADMQAKSPTEIFAMEGAGGYVPMVRNGDGSTKAAGGFFPGQAPAPFSLPTLPPSAEAQAQATASQAMQQEAMLRGQGMVPVPPKQATDVAGRTYAPAPSTQEQPFKGRIQTEGGVETTDPKTGQKTTSPMRQYTVMQDASGNLVKRYIKDENGDGIPDAQAKEESAPSWLDWLSNQTK